MVFHFNKSSVINQLPNNQRKDFKIFAELYYEKLQYQGAFLLAVKLKELSPKAQRQILLDAMDLWIKRPKRG